jgi:DNA-binding transcriptional regulator LsrR (DeoR family)
MSGEVAKAHVARLYYEHDLTKREIAQRLGISRFKVARLLDQARAEGIVRVEIEDPVDIQSDLSRALEDAFGLDLAVVVRDPRAIPRATAAWLPELVREGDTLGVAWGTTLQSVAPLIETGANGPGAPTDVVQICGAVPGLTPGTGPNELALRFAEQLGGRLYALPCPAVVGEAARTDLLANDVVGPTFAMFGEVDLVLLGIGVAGELEGPPDGAAGYMLVHLFGADGRPLGAEETDRAISMSRAQLGTTRVVAAAGGHMKRRAVLGALRTGLLNALVTDAATASHALGERGIPRPTR